MKTLSLILFAMIFVISNATASDRMPLIDTHIHYSHDAWEMLPPEDAVDVIRKAGLKKAFVSSSSDDGTQMLFKAAPDLIVPVLRPYRKRGELGTWYRDETVIKLLEDRLANNRYAGIGEFHIFGDDVFLPVMKRVVSLAKEYRIFLHAHSDSEAVENIFKLDPDARVLWAHSGFEGPMEVRRMLNTYPKLTADLAFRNEHAVNGEVDPDWRQLFLEFPDRIMIGTDTFTPERWYYVIDHAEWSREWLSSLPKGVAQQIGYENAERLSNWALGK